MTFEACDTERPSLARLGRLALALLVPLAVGCYEGAPAGEADGTDATSQGGSGGTDAGESGADGTDSDGEPLVLDFKELKFLNSSGITALSLFVVGARKAGTPRLKLVGSKATAWQQKSLANFQMLWKEMPLVIE